MIVMGLGPTSDDWTFTSGKDGSLICGANVAFSISACVVVISLWLVISVLKLRQSQHAQKKAEKIERELHRELEKVQEQANADRQAFEEAERIRRNESGNARKIKEKLKNVNVHGEKLQAQIERMRQEGNASKEEKCQSDKKIKELNKVAREKDQEARKLKNKVDTLEKKKKDALTSLQNEVKNLKKQLEAQKNDRDAGKTETERALKDKQKEIDDLKTKHKEEVDALEKDKQEGKKNSDTRFRVIRAESDKQQGEVKELKSLVQDKERELHQQNERTNVKIESLTSSLKEKEDAVREWEKYHRTAQANWSQKEEEIVAKSAELKKESDTLATKLMSFSIARDTDRFQNLNDKCRADVAATRFKEVYESERLDALDVLEELGTESPEDEQLVCRLLMLTNDYIGEKVQSTVDAQITAIEGLLTEFPEQALSEVRSDMERYVKGRLKENYDSLDMPKAVKGLVEKLKGEIAVLEEAGNDERFSDFLERCVDTAWLIQLQTPPLVLAVDRSAPYSPDSHRISGSCKKPKPDEQCEIDIFAWPSLLTASGRLHEKGVVSVCPQK